MPRKLLNEDEIKSLVKLLKELFYYIKNWKSLDKLYECIQLPKIPSLLSESLIINLIQREKILTEYNIKEVDFGGRKADVLAFSNDNNELKIEVKATGESAFQYFGEKDIGADILIWVHFDKYFLGNHGSKIKIFVIKSPSNLFSEPTKITLNKLKKEFGNLIREIEVDL